MYKASKPEMGRGHFTRLQRILSKSAARLNKTHCYSNLSKFDAFLPQINNIVVSMDISADVTIPGAYTRLNSFGLFSRISERIFFC